jgi:hypothetical protein
MPGTSIFPAEVSGVTKRGLWLLLDEQEELFLPFAEFPWFRSAPVDQIFHLERPQSHHLYWPELDVDLHVDSVRQPEKFPLVARA